MKTNITEYIENMLDKEIENIEDAIDVLNDQAARIKNPTYSYLKEAYEMGAKALNIIKTIYIQNGDQ